MQPEPRQTVRLWSFLPAKKTDYIELQAADLFAYWLREYAEAVDYKKIGAGGLNPVSQRLLSGTDYVYWNAERFAVYLDHQAKVEPETRRDWWKQKMWSRRRKREEE